jgi:hypothetical protein
MGNQQLYNLNNNQLQVIFTGILGDGHLTIPKNLNSNSHYVTNCKYKEYLEFKQNLLGNLSFNIGHISKNGYSQTEIYTLSSKKHKDITAIRALSMQELLNSIDELGIALWFYDDGSLHKNKLFYNLNTHKFSKNIQEELFIPFFNKFNIFPKITQEVKKDGRIFYYLRISRFEGAYEISKILSKYPLNCYSYKLWSSETIQLWSKLQAKLKSEGKIVSNKMFGQLLSEYAKGTDLQDIVQSLQKCKASSLYRRTGI